MATQDDLSKRNILYQKVRFSGRVSFFKNEQDLTMST